MIEIRNLHVVYQSDGKEVRAVDGVSLAIPEGHFYTMLGPSGCGKTTTLRCVAGLETPTTGEIAIAGDAVFSSTRSIYVPSYRRDIGMVFQSYAIWPHMNVFENVAFPLRERRRPPPRAEIRRRVEEVLALVQLAGYEDRPAPFLSGGQQQRLALARALVREPKVLLLDEPLSNLDAKLREETRVELRQLVKRLGITTVFVTHDQLEALTMSDTVAVMRQGRIVQEGPPRDIYGEPAARFVADFIGTMNFIDGRVAQVPYNGTRFGSVETDAGTFACTMADGIRTGDKVLVGIRPEDIRLATPGGSPADNRFGGDVVAAIFLGDAVEYEVALGASRLRLKMHPKTVFAPGDRVELETSPESCRALPA